MVTEDKEKMMEFLKPYAKEHGERWVSQTTTIEYLKVDELIDGGCYLVAGRNFTVAIWTNGDFYGIREKFGGTFIDKELHWDLDNTYGTVRPIKLLTMYKE